MHQSALLIYIHVPKTAGGSFKQWLCEYFSGNVLLHKREPKIDGASERRQFKGNGDRLNGATVRDVRELYREQGLSGFDGYDAIGGHFTYDFPFLKRLERPLLICSAVRDPVERIVSRYIWAQLNKGGVHWSCVEGRTLFQSLQEKGPFYRSADNQQLDFIFGKKRDNDNWTIIIKYNKYDKLIQKIADIYNKPIINFPHLHRIDNRHKQEVYGQPDYPAAESLIRLLNAEEIDFLESFDDIVELNCRL